MINTKTYSQMMNDFLRYFKGVGDIREGTAVHIMASATAAAFAELYNEIDNFNDAAFVATATGKHLDDIVAMLGLERRGETNAVVKIEGGEGLRVGDKVVSGEMEYVIEEIAEGYYLGKCTTAGTIGNGYVGEVVSVGRSDVVGELNIVEIVAHAEDVESDDELRKRFVEIANCPVCTGNMSYYRSILDSITGVGGRKVVPVPEGVGTVKVIVTDTEYSVADESLTKYVKNLLDPEEKSGLGYGLVPLGHKVTVESVEKVDINIEVEVKNKEGDDTTVYYCRFARAEMPKILREMNKEWDKTDNIIIRDRIIEDYMIGEGAYDVNVISINSQPNRLILAENQIIGDVTFNGS